MAHAQTQLAGLADGNYVWVDPDAREPLVFISKLSGDHLPTAAYTEKSDAAASDKYDVSFAMQSGCAPAQAELALSARTAVFYDVSGDIEVNRARS